MKINEIDNTNPLVKKFEQYLLLNYSNNKTRELYLKESRRFLNQVTITTGKEPTKMTQDLLDKYVMFLRSKIRPNSFYRGFIGAWRECFDPEDEFGRRHLAFKVPKNRSREATISNDYGWLSEENINNIKQNANPYISLTTQIYFETGLRKMELINTNLSSKPDNEIGVKFIDFEKRRMSGIGKGNKPFIVHFSEETAERIKIWLTECYNPIRPFLIFKKSGEPYKNQDKEMWTQFRKECKRIGVTLPDGGGTPHTHNIRHGLGRFLRRDKKWDIIQVSYKLRHSDPKTTMKYSDSTIEEIEKLDEKIFDEAKQNEKTNV